MGLLKGNTDLLFCKLHLICFDGLQNYINLRASPWNLHLTGFPIYLRVDPRLHEEKQVHFSFIQIQVLLYSIILITGHSGNRIKIDIISRHKSGIISPPLRPILCATSKNFLDDNKVRIRTHQADVALLSFHVLKFCRNPYISIVQCTSLLIV